MSTILETRGLTHVYGAGTPFERVALDHVDIQINKGEILGVIGHTGSGKSTLIQHLNGLLQPSEGEVLLDGKSIWDAKGWYFSIRSISCSRRRLRRTSPTARPT